MIAGREPGVSALPSGGITGEGARIRIRGASSLSQSNEPIVYVDGVRVDRQGGWEQLANQVGQNSVSPGGGGAPSRLDDINPDAIERIEVLKGAAAATLYGSEASNGVIQIFTKAGNTGAPSWTYRGELGTVNYSGSRIKPNAGFARDDEQLQNMRQLWNAPNLELFDVVQAPLVEDQLFETGMMTSHSLSVSGGTSVITYFLGGRYQWEDGPFGGTDMCAVGCALDKTSRGQGSLTVNVFPADRLRIRLSSQYAETRAQVPNNGNNIYGVPSLTMFAKPEQAECDASSIAGPFECTGAGNPFGNPAFATTRETMQVETSQEAQHYTGSLGVNYTFTDELTADVTVGLDFVNQVSTGFQPFGYNVDGVTGDNPQGERDVNDRNARQVTFDSKLSWNTTIGDDVTSGLIVGGQGFIEEVTEEWGEGEILPGPGFEVAGAAGLQSLGEGFQQIVNAGVFGQWQGGWNDWTFFTVGGRLDYNSAFGETGDPQFYPKASLSVIPSSRPGWTSNTLSTFRVRGAIGQSGLQPGAFDKLTTFQPLNSEVGPGVGPFNLGNSTLKPEVSTEWELGAELGLFNDVLGVEATYWDRTVQDALVARQFPFTGGFRRQQLVNIGEIQATGVELLVNWLAYQGNDASLDVFVNAAYIDEQVTDLGGAPPIKVGGTYTRYRNFIREGSAPGAYFGVKLADVPAGALPVDLNGDGQPDTREELLASPELAGPFSISSINANTTLLLADDDGDGDRTDHFLGKPTPDWSGSFGINFSVLRNFTLQSLFEYKFGDFYVENLTDAFRQANGGIGRNIPVAAEAESKGLNPNSSPQERLEAIETWIFELAALSPQPGLNTISQADMLRWRELSLTYTLPSNAVPLGMDGLSLTVTGRNLALWTNYNGVDPEGNVSGRGGATSTGGSAPGFENNFGIGIDAFRLPLPTRWALGVRATF